MSTAFIVGMAMILTVLGVIVGVVAAMARWRSWDFFRAWRAVTIFWMVIGTLDHVSKHDGIDWSTYPLGLLICAVIGAALAGMALGVLRLISPSVSPAQ